MAPAVSAGYRVQQRADIERGCHSEYGDRAGAPLSYAGLASGYAHGVGPQPAADPLLHLGERRFSQAALFI